MWVCLSHWAQKKLKSLKCLQQYNSPKMHKSDDSCRTRDTHLPFTATIPQTSLTYSHATNCDFGRKTNMAGDHCRQLPTTARSDFLFFCFFSPSKLHLATFEMLLCPKFVITSKSNYVLIPVKLIHFRPWPGTTPTAMICQCTSATHTPTHTHTPTLPLSHTHTDSLPTSTW